MQEKWIYLEDVLQDQEHYEELTKHYVSYHPDRWKLNLPINSTGWRENQVLETETNFEWHPIMFGGKIYLVAHEPTKMLLGLGRTRGFNNCLEIFQEYSKMYTCESLGTKVASLTIEMFESLPAHIRNIPKIAFYWLASCRTIPGYRTPAFTIFYVRNNHVDDAILNVWSGAEFFHSYPVRPVVQLPRNILVEKDSVYCSGLSPETAWKLRWEGSQEEYKYVRRKELQVQIKEAKTLIHSLEEELNSLN